MVKILLSNDDGIYAQGLQVLADALKDVAELNIVAPDRDRSGASNSLTLSAPIRIKEIAENRVSVEGTPTDCVHLAITGLLNELPDMVMTGINCGSNLGDDVWYSGTVAAAMEGRFLGLPAVAISLVGGRHKHYHTAAIVARRIMRHIQEYTLPPQTILNINVPDVHYEELQGYLVTRLGTRHRAEPTIRQLDPRGNEIYWVGPAGLEQDAGKGTDFYAINNQCVSITPLRVDMTDYEAFERLSTWVSGLHETV